MLFKSKFLNFILSTVDSSVMVLAFDTSIEHGGFVDAGPERPCRLPEDILVSAVFGTDMLEHCPTVFEDA